MSIETKRRRRRRNVAHVRGYLQTHPCIKCGYDGVAKQFHHRDGSQKDSTVSRLVSTAASLTRIDAEIAKCDVLCCVCHTELHAPADRPLWSGGELEIDP